MSKSSTLTGSPKVRLWLPEASIEDAALKQIRNTATLPWVHGVRIMPDAHHGKGAVVGSVIAMRDAVSPSTVGVDIGCGVVAVKTSLIEEDLERMGELRSRVETAIPVGFNSHKDETALRQSGITLGVDSLFGDWDRLHEGVQHRKDRALSQVGTLGGGNHFIEVCVDEDGHVWLTLHSGSRNVGKELAERHIEAAKGLSHNQGLMDRDLAVFLGGTKEMDAYRHDLWWAQDYAALSRKAMMALLKREVRQHFAGASVKFGEEINVHHNYVAEEQIEGETMLVTRKGAIRAGKGDLALIPGSMGTGSYVVKGRGNPASFQSASHGAGRKMSRTAAKKAFTTEDLIAQTMGVESRKDQAIVDEIPGAYKDIKSVIEQQSDLVEVMQHLRTVLCVKG